MKIDINRNYHLVLNKSRVILAAAGFVLFIIIALFIATNESLLFDTVICNTLYDFRNEGLTFILTAVTYLGNWQTITLISIAFLAVPRTRSAFGFPLSASAILAVTIQKLLKLWFQRPRPDLSLHLISQGGYSFPSGHSFTILVFYGLLIFLCRQYIQNRTASNSSIHHAVVNGSTSKTAANWITGLLSLLIFAIGFSRIYLGVHFPTDILGGWSLGLCLLMILISIKGKDKAPNRF